MPESNADKLSRVQSLGRLSPSLTKEDVAALRYVLESRAELLAIARRTAEHFADTDAPLGIAAREVIRAIGGPS